MTACVIDQDLNGIFKNILTLICYTYYCVTTFEIDVTF